MIADDFGDDLIPVSKGLGLVLHEVIIPSRETDLRCLEF